MNKIELRVDFDKDGGLFIKRSKPNRYLWISAVGSGSDGLDLIKIGSNRGRRFRIGRWGLLRGGSGGGTHRRRVPAAARGENSPEMAEIGHTGVESMGFWVGRTPHIMRDPLGRFPGFGGGRGGVCGGGGGCARRSIAGVRSRGYWGVLQSKVASVKVRRGLGGAHRGSETSREAALAGRRRRPATRVTRSSGRRLL